MYTYKIPFYALAFIFLLTAAGLWLPLQASSLSKEGSQKEIKILVLIIASDNHPAFIELQDIWKSYMHSAPEHVEVYFMKGDPSLSSEAELIGDTIYTRVADSYKPGIITKTIASMELLLDKIKECDYVLRTNLSSFYYFPNLLKFLDQLPRTGCYSARILSPYYADVTPEFLNIPFGWGAGFILSPDLAEMLVEGKQEILEHGLAIPDDVLIGAFFHRKGVKIIPAAYENLSNYFIWEQRKNDLPGNSFHFRAKKSLSIRQANDEYYDECKILRELVEQFYLSNQ